VRCLRRTEAFGQIFFDKGVGTKFDARMRLRNLTMEYVINLSRKLLRPVPRLDPPPILTAWISSLKYLQEVGQRRLPLRSLLQHQERNARLRTQPLNPCKSPCCLALLPRPIDARIPIQHSDFPKSPEFARGVLYQIYELFHPRPFILEVFDPCEFSTLLEITILFFHHVEEAGESQFFQ
jgi:hypothetical protein